MSWFRKSPLVVKMAIVALPLAIVGFVASTVAINTYKQHRPSVVAEAISQPDFAAVLSDTTYSPPPGYTMPTTCPAPYTGTPPNCQPPTDSTSPAPNSTTTPSNSTPQPTTGSTQPSGTTQPTTCPAPYTGTPPNCQAPAGSTYSAPPTTSQPSTNGNYTPPSGSYNYQPANGQSQPPAPPTLTVSNGMDCIDKIFGADMAAKFRSGAASPTPAQMAQAQSCFSAQVSYGPGPSGGQSGSPNIQGGSSYQPPAYANIAIAPPQAFQADSPMVACAKGIVGDHFGSQPSPDQMAQIQSKCFANATSGGQIGFIDPSGQNRGGPLPGVALASGGPNGGEGNRGALPSLPPEIKSCVLKAGISEADINAIQHGQSPTVAQQAAGEGCFSQYAKDKGYTPPTLTPPDPSQPFDPNSKQNQCADLVAQTHGIRFNQINPGVVVSWSADDVGKLRSCYGVAPASSAGSNGVAFAPTSPQVTVSSSKLTCMQTALGADKLAAVVAGTATVSDTERRTVYDKCINPTKIASGANPALLGVLAAMPPSDIESQFIPVDSQTLPAPTASDVNQSNNGEVTVGGEVDVAAGATLPTKVDVFVKSTPQTFTVALKKVNATKAVWSVNVAQNKLPLGNHEAYAVTTLADATQLRSPSAKFAVATAKAAKSHLALIVGSIVAVIGLAAGGFYAFKWHKKHTQTAQ